MLFDGKEKGKKIEVLFKDWEKINQKNDFQYKESFKKLKKQLELAEIEGYDKVFLDEKFITHKNHQPEHKECGMIKEKKKTSTVTEKRICRCMKYFGQHNFCKECPLKYKYHNISKTYKIIDAEVPTIKDIKSCGGIDLVFENIKNPNIKYAVEVKPPKSKETLVRMIAEIYTYTTEEEFKNYKKAIAFFDKSEQELFYEKFKNEDFFKDVIKDITIFKFVYKDNLNGVIDFDIVNLTDNEQFNK